MEILVKEFVNRITTAKKNEHLNEYDGKKVDDIKKWM